jgi:hypothetical protein
MLESLSHIRALFPIQGNSGVIQILHKSVKDYFVDSARSHDFCLVQRMGDMQRKMALECVRTIKASVKRDMCGLGACGKTSDAECGDHIQRTIPQHVQYACRHWATHVYKSMAADSPSRLDHEARAGTHTVHHHHHDDDKADSMASRAATVTCSADAIDTVDVMHAASVDLISSPTCLFWLEAVATMRASSTASSQLRSFIEAASLVCEAADFRDAPTNTHVTIARDLLRMWVMFQQRVIERPGTLYAVMGAWVPRDSELYKAVGMWVNTGKVTLPIENMHPNTGWDPCVNTLQGHAYFVHKVRPGGINCKVYGNIII